MEISLNNNKNTDIGFLVDTVTGQTYSINLSTFGYWCINADRRLIAEQVKAIEDFINTKMNNGTLYTAPEMQNYSKLKRFQLFVNSNTFEQVLAATLGGEVLKGNDLLTIDSVAVIGEDGCALSDLLIDGIEVEAKVTFSYETRHDVLLKAHKKPVVAIYTIKPMMNESHFDFFIRNTSGGYVSVDEIIARKVYVAPDCQKLVSKVINWQDEMRARYKSLPLVHIDKLKDGSAIISKFF